MASDDAICFTTSLVPAKGTVLFEEGDHLKDVEKGGGDFTVRAYVSSTGSCYLDDAWVKFFSGGTEKWHFRDDGGTPGNITDDAYVDYYWPKGYDLDFFAYMPYKYNERFAKTYVSIGEHTPAGGPSFSCSLSLENEKDFSMQDFIYAYASDQNLTTQGTDGVKLRFVHPLSCIVLVLKESYRMKIRSVAFENLYSNGKYSNGYSTVDFGGNPAANFTSACWTYTGGRAEKMTYEIDEDVPGVNINFNSEVGGPYIVIPQSLGYGAADDQKVRLAINYDRDDEPDATKRIAIATSAVPSWEPGKKYTYNIYIGDPAEEILFNVLVDEWDVVDYRHEIDVE